MSVAAAPLAADSIMQNSMDENSKIRISKLKKEISKHFEHLAPDEVEVLASYYKKHETRMIEIIQVREESAFAMDLFETVELTHVIFPKAILPLLEPHDVFLATVGLNHKMWEVIYLTPPYSEIVEEHQLN